MEYQKKTGTVDSPEERTLTSEAADPDYVIGDGTSQRILKKWQSGVIICIWPKFFLNEDDIEMG